MQSCRKIQAPFTFLFLSALFSGSSQAQEELFSLSIAELLTIPVYSASKSYEPLQDAPASISVLERERIISSGARSIPELLRLIPGVIVREQTTGIYDVHIRGMENIPPNTGFGESVNAPILVMINNRPVFDYFSGRTSWEALPITVEDLQRIEVVRGASSALYGPNAASGTINLFTHGHSENSALHVDEALHFNASSGNRDFRKLHIQKNTSLSKNSFLNIHAFHMEADRYQSTYYEQYDQQYTPLEALERFPDGSPFTAQNARYPDPDTAIERSALNGNFHFQDEDLKWVISLGTQFNRNHKIYIDTLTTPFTVNAIQSDYLNSELQYGKVNWRISRTSAQHQTYGLSYVDYRQKIWQSSLDYETNFGNLRLQPEVSFSHQNYEANYLDGDISNHHYAFALRGKYRAMDNLNLHIALREELFKTPDRNQFSWSSSLVYALTPQQQLRLTSSRANRTAPFSDLFTELSVDIPASNERYDYSGNPDLKFQELDSLELGYRYSRDSWSLETEIFSQRVRNFSSVALQGQRIEGATTVSEFSYVNPPLKSEQHGVSLMWNWIANQRLQTSIHATWQETEIMDHPEDPAQPNTLHSWRSRGSPNVYGGASLEWMFKANWHLHLSTYHIGSSVFDLERIDDSNGFPRDAYVKPHWILNSNLMWDFHPDWKISLKLRNLGTEQKQFAYADTIKSTASIQLHGAL